MTDTEQTGYCCKALCSLCSETIQVERHNGKATPPFPKNWFVDLVHDHNRVEPQWRMLIYYRERKGRYPLEAKDIRLLAKLQKQEATQQRRISNDSRPGGSRG